MDPGDFRLCDVHTTWREVYKADEVSLFKGAPTG